MQQRYATTGRRDVYSPRERETGGSADPSEALTAWVETWNRTMTSMVDTWTQAVRSGWEPYMQPAEREAPRRYERHHEKDCGCHKHKHECDCGCKHEHCGHECCKQDDCACRCCVGDVDLLVNSRVGERRVVPLVIENNSRREREVELELSDWTARGEKGEVKVTGMLVDPPKFILKACSEETISLVVQSIGDEESPNDSTENRRKLGDVGECKVFYADLRVKGCDIRPIRIAVALLPRECDPYTINCHCGCC